MPLFGGWQSFDDDHESLIWEPSGVVRLPGQCGQRQTAWVDPDTPHQHWRAGAVDRRPAGRRSAAARRPDQHHSDHDRARAPLQHRSRSRLLLGRMWCWTVVSQPKRGTMQFRVDAEASGSPRRQLHHRQHELRWSLAAMMYLVGRDAGRDRCIRVGCSVEVAGVAGKVA